MLTEAELKEGGKDIEVTFENREEYVRRCLDEIINLTRTGPYDGETGEAQSNACQTNQN